MTLSPTRPAAGLVAPLAESRPPALCWSLATRLEPDPAQPRLDLWARTKPLVVAPANDPAAVGLPDARDWSAALAVTLLEVVTFRRPSCQLSRWLAEEVYTGLVGRLPGRRPVGHPSARPALRSVHLQYPAVGVAEVSVHGRLDQRSVVMALRLEAQHGRWLCTALELGPLP